MRAATNYNLLKSTLAIGAAITLYTFFAGYMTVQLDRSGQASTPKLIIVPRNDSVDAKWHINFKQLPDGPLPRQYFNFEEGTKVADYNNEAQAYTSRTSNVRIENGVLVIEAKPERLHGREYTSARIDTKGKFAFTYGTFEAEMMMPKGVGTWPAGWLMPSKEKYQAGDYGINDEDQLKWVLNGEIDFAEAIGRLPGQNIPAAHSYNEMHQAPTYTPAYIADAYTQYHRYGIIKTPDKITFTIDGQPYATRVKTSNNVLDWPYDQPYYAIFNLAIGGKWAGDEGIDPASAPWQLKIKSLSYRPL